MRERLHLESEGEEIRKIGRERDLGRNGANEGIEKVANDGAGIAVIAHPRISSYV